MASQVRGPKLGLLVCLVLCTLLGSSVGQRTLFPWDSPVAQFTADNFTQTVIDSDTAWVVDFYATWCGHCQRFAPTWTQFARRIQGWNSMVNVGAIACSEQDNIGVCREFGVRGYPTVKFFPPKAANHVSGRQFDGRKTLTSLRHTTVNYLIHALRDNANPLPPSLTDEWPQLDNYVHLEDVATAASRQGSVYAFVVAEDTDPFLGQELILDMSAYYPTVFVARMLRTDGEHAGIRRFPSLHFLNEESYLTEIPGTDHASMLSTMQYYVSATTTTPATATSPFLVSTAGPSDGLHMQDLESSLYYSLWNEVGGQAELSGRRLQALKTHLFTLAKYHPGRPHIVKFLNKTSEWLRDKTLLDGEQWKNGITALQTQDAYIPDRVAWTGCSGSRPHFRGYPCSLWMTFHALTVNAIDVNGRSPNFDPQEVLHDMKGYIKQFFGCRTCARHFGKMAETMEQEVTSRADGITWLWRAHNKANNRLHGDTSEDPVNPKIQFPRNEACSSCRLPGSGNGGPFDNNTMWAPESVLAYLRFFYGKTNIIEDALPYTFVQPTSYQGFSTNVTEAFLTTEATPMYSNRSERTLAPPTCVLQETLWSPCSHTCDTGVSTRLSNNNSDCQMKMEARLCSVRPCRAVEYLRGNNRDPQIARTCPDHAATYRVRGQTPLRYGNCQTVQNFFGRETGSKICGLCPGRCCYPSEERTLELNIQCGSHVGMVRVQHIDQCDCPVTCPENYRSWYDEE